MSLDEQRFLLTQFRSYLIHFRNEFRGDLRILGTRLRDDLVQADELRPAIINIIQRLESIESKLDLLLTPPAPEEEPPIEEDTLNGNSN